MPHQPSRPDVTTSAASPSAPRSDLTGDILRLATESVRSNRDLHSAIDRILADLENFIPYDRALVWLIDEQNQTLSTAMGRWLGKPWNPAWTDALEQTPFTGVLRETAFAAYRREELSNLHSNTEPIRAAHFLVGPIRDVDRTLGVLSLTRLSTDQPFTSADVAAVETVAGLASIAIRMSIAVEAEREHRHRALQFGILTASLNQAHTPSAVAAALLRGLNRLLGIDHGYVVLLNPAQPDAVSVHLSEPLRVGGQAVVSGLKPADRAVEKELMRTRRSVCGSRLRDLLEIPPIATPDGMHGLAAIPIRNGTRLDGVLYLWSPLAPSDPGFEELPASALDTAETLCAQAAVAIERTRLQELAQQTAHEQRTLADISSRLASADTPETMASTALSALASMLTTRYARVSVCQSIADRPQVLGAIQQEPGIDPSTERTLRMLEEWVRLDGHDWNGPLATWIVESTAIDADLARNHVGCWPLTASDTTIGTLTVVREREYAFTARELEVVTHACGQLALGLQRASSHAEAVLARDAAEQQASGISHLLRITNEMSRQHDLDDLLFVMDKGLSSLLPFTEIEVYRADDERERLECIYHRDTSGSHPVETHVSYGVGAIGRAARLRRPAQGTRVGAAGTSRMLGMPMVIEGSLLGVIGISRDERDPFSQQELSLVGIFSAHAASEVSRADLTMQNRELYIGGIRALTSTVDAKDPYTRGHSARVGRIARLIAEEMRLPPGEVRQIELAALLHDVGKIGIPDAILQKPAPLDLQERAIMMGHTDLGALILENAQSKPLESLIPYVRHHHEWWDGRGYPGSLRGTDIPLGARIISVADALDTMTNERPYRQRLSTARAWSVLEAGSGTQFAPDAVAALGRVLASTDPEDLALPGEFLPEAGMPADQEDLALGTPGRLGDLRSLGVLVGLARITSHMTDLHDFLKQTTAMLAERLDLRLVIVIRPEPDQPNQVEAVARTSDGFRVIDDANPDCVTRILASELPASIDRIPPLAEHPVVHEVFTSLRNAGVVPLVAEGRVSGVLIFEPLERDRYWKADVDVIEAIAPHVTAAINVASMHERAKEDALTDGLTGALNYRAFHRALGEHIARDAPFAVLMFDVVGLKVVNDTLGHLAGDTLLRRVAEQIAAALDPSCSIARIGGDEFGVLITEDDLVRQPEAVGRRILEGMAREVAPQFTQSVSLRYGWAIYPDEATTPELLFNTADQRMYQHSRDIEPRSRHTPRLAQGTPGGGA